ncbi:hypothetical protein STEG23_032202, partial [Scotinomys teguina]
CHHKNGNERRTDAIVKIQTGEGPVLNDPEDDRALSSGPLLRISIPGFTEQKVSQSVCYKVLLAVKRHHDYGNYYKGKHLIGVVDYSSEVQSIIIMVGLGSMQADMVLEKELRVLHLYLAGNKL